ncbi:glycoside hydrolase/deacetylase [Neocallimastix lanati (nom. inval.)]|nr:glycoside hydrolase/deacetylase [Neocallimastix sp. JGI-2020a]
MRFTNTITLSLVAAAAVQANMIYHCKEPNTIALTFDDGPNDRTTPQLLDILKANNIHATFFINGDNYIGNLEENEVGQEILRREHEEGHQIAFHTWKHLIPDTKEGIKESMDRLDNLIESVAGYRPKYFRAPLGDISKETIEYFESLDDEAGKKKRVEMVKKFLTDEFAQERENYLVLMHDINTHTAEQIVPWITDNAPFDKYKFVTVAECLGDKDKGKNDTYNVNGNKSSSEQGSKNENKNNDTNNQTNDNGNNTQTNQDDGNSSNLNNDDQDTNKIIGEENVSNLQNNSKNGAGRNALNIYIASVLLLSTIFMLQ